MEKVCTLPALYKFQISINQLVLIGIKPQKCDWQKFK